MVSRQTMYKWMLVLALPLWAVGAEQKEGIELKTLVLVPAGEPSPVLGIRLMPRPSELKSGNAALFYNAALGFQPKIEEDAENQLEQWRDQAVDQWPRPEVQKLLDSFAHTLRYIRLGTHCRNCDWELPLEDGFDLVMPPLGDFRRMAKLMTLRTRMAIADGQVDQAVASVQDGLVMGMNMDEGPLLVQSLVGMAIARVTLDELEHWCQTPGMPNLYWALTALPRPLVTARKAYDYEYDMLLNTFPGLRDIDTVILTAAQAQRLAQDIMFKAGSLDNTPQPRALDTLAPTAWVMIQYRDAKAWLRKQGWSQERIEAMPAAQAVLIYQLRQYRQLYEEGLKNFFLPYNQGCPLLKQVEEDFNRHYSQGLKTNLFVMYLPALYRVNEIEAWLARDIAMQRVIEALRWYAADHERQLPHSLNQITVVPVPPDPVTGKAFVYRCNDGVKARLEAPLYTERETRRPVFALTVRQLSK